MRTAARDEAGRTVLYEIQFDAPAELLRSVAKVLERARDDFVSSAPCTPSTGTDTDSEKGTAP